MVIVYDVGIERVNKVRIYLKQYLHWVQNSVFEGELTDSEYLKVMNGIKDIIDQSNDHILCYKSRDKRYLDISELGSRKSDITTII